MVALLSEGEEPGAGRPRTPTGTPFHGPYTAAVGKGDWLSRSRIGTVRVFESRGPLSGPVLFYAPGFRAGPNS